TGNGTYNLLFQDGNMYYRHAKIGAASWSKPYAFYHEGNKPSASDVGAYSKSQTYSKSEADKKFTVGYATADKAGLVRVKVSGDTLEIFTS
ncbi:hypothetical protein, partial [Salinivibrio sp. VYel6]|uniref:hypothetical protein n=1 Tax=Salinivibrio sp. VYel6 TaxID=2490493 RepID=UPI001C129F97